MTDLVKRARNEADLMAVEPQRIPDRTLDMLRELADRIEALERELSGRIGLEAAGITNGSEFRQMWTEMRLRAESAEAERDKLVQKLMHCRQLAEGSLQDDEPSMYSALQRIAVLATPSHPGPEGEGKTS
jgi:hypothetical protein